MAVRWHARYMTELSQVGLAESQLVLVAVAALSTDHAPVGAAALLEVAKARRLWGFDVALRPLLGEQR